MPATFPHAVASFEPTATGVLLWTHLGDGGTTAEWVVAGDPDMGEVVRRGTATTSAAQDHCVVVDVDGLNPATSYWYRFTVGARESPVGRTRTLPDGDVESFRIGLVCCARFSVAPLGVYRALAEREVDVILHLGDYIYEDGGDKGPRTHEPPHRAVTLDDYRRRLAQVRADPDTQSLHLRHPVVTIWDDHDLADNAWRDGAKQHDADRDGPWPERVAAAARARQEWLPARLRDSGHPSVIWRSVVIGDLAEIVLLDARLVGRDRQAGDGVGPALDDPERSLLGGDQRAWADERLADLDRPWCVLVSGTVVNVMELDWPRPLRWVGRLLPSGYAILDGRVMHDDQWDGYPAERRRLVSWMSERGRAGGRTVILSGDVHSSWAFEGPLLDGTDEAVAVEFTVPAVSSAAMGRARYPGMWRLLDRAADHLAHVRWADVTSRGYAILELTPEAAHCHWWFVHPYDEDPAGGAELAAGFVTARPRWPPDLVEHRAPRSDPIRPGLPAPLPGRPADLRAIRRRRRVRLGAEAVVIGTLLLAPPVTAAVLLARRVR